MDRTALGLILCVLALFVLIQPGLPSAQAHGGAHAPEDEHPDEVSQGEAPPGEGFHANASAVIPYEPYIRQENPAIHGSMIVWEESEIGRPANIVAYNLSTDEGAFPLSTRAINERNPTVHGPWIAWEQHHEGDNATVDIAVLDVRTGTTITIPDDGHDQTRPAIANNGTVYYAERHGEDEHLRAFDLLTRTTWEPIGGTEIFGGPSTYGHTLAWAEVSTRHAKIVTLDTRNMTKETVPDRWNIREGPLVGPHGVAFVANNRGLQGGTYTVTYNEEDGVQHRRTGVYPHKDLDHCANGVVWGQPGISVSELDHVSAWDPYTLKTTHLGVNNTNPACSGDHVVYEKRIAGGDEEPVPRIYVIDFRELRLGTDAEIRLDPGLERSIITDTTTLTGTILPGDPREPVDTVVARIDRDSIRMPETEPLPDGGVRWSITVDPDRYPSGLRTLQVSVVDTMGTRTVDAFTFFTDTPYILDESRLDRTLDVPRTDPSPFPFSILDHYKAYQPFYNTVILVIILIVVVVIGVIRYRANKPPEPPRYVPPDDPYAADEP